MYAVAVDDSPAASPPPPAATDDDVKGGWRSTIRARPETVRAKAKNMRGLRDRHKAQIPNARKASARTSRSQAHGRFE